MDVDNQRADEGAPRFTIACLFHHHLDVLERTLPRSLAAASEVMRRREEWGLAEVRFRRRKGHVASGDSSNNGHRLWAANDSDDRTNEP
jgi:hypothetical protein